MGITKDRLNALADASEHADELQDIVVEQYELKGLSTGREFMVGSAVTLVYEYVDAMRRAHKLRREALWRIEEIIVFAQDNGKMQTEVAATGIRDALKRAR